MLSKNRIHLIFFYLLISCVSISATENSVNNYLDKTPKKEKKVKSAKKSTIKSDKNAPLVRDTTLQTKIAVTDTTPKKKDLAIDSVKRVVKKDPFMLKPNTPIKADTLKQLILVADTSKKIQEKKLLGDLFADGYARISKKNGDIIVASLKTKNIYEIRFVYPLNTIEEKINLSEINSINYADGTIDVINSKLDKVGNKTTNPDSKVGGKNKTEKVTKPDVDVTDDDIDWETVEVTDSIDKANGLVEIGPIETRYVGSITVTNSSLEKSGSIIIRKKAAHMKANLIVVSSKIIDRQYGELPSIQLKGTAYGKGN